MDVLEKMEEEQGRFGSRLELNITCLLMPIIYCLPVP
jgi:hypothetical protein